jgi:C_GCAxxG_C_C family probable redox protein
MSVADDAVEIFNQRFNCSQAVLATCGAKRGLDRKAALQVAEVFGGGMGRMGLTCGAVTGAFMAIGLVHAKVMLEDNTSRQKSIELARKFREKFEARHESICCRELLGVDLSQPAGYQQAIDKGVFVSVCPKLVHDAVEIVEELLGPGTNVDPSKKGEG